MTKRERTIAIGVGVAFGVLALNYAVITPLWDKRTKLQDDIVTANAAFLSDKNLISRRASFEAQWNDIVARGMVYDSTLAAAQVSNVINQCATLSGVKFGNLSPDNNPSTINKPGGRPGEKEKNFLKVASRFSGEGGLTQIGEFVFYMQRSTIPMRINDISVSSKSEQQNVQEVHMTVSTIFLAPEGSRPGDLAVQPTSRPGGTTRPTGQANTQAGSTSRPSTNVGAAAPAPSTLPANAAAIEEQMRLRRLQQQSGTAAAAPAPATGPSTRTEGRQ